MPSSASVLPAQGDGVHGDGPPVDLPLLGRLLCEAEPPVHGAYGVVALQHLTGEDVEPRTVLVVERVARGLLHHLNPGGHGGALGAGRLVVEVEAPGAGAFRSVEVEVEVVHDPKGAALGLEDQHLAGRIVLDRRPPGAVLVLIDLVVMDADLAVHGLVAPPAHVLHVGFDCGAQHVILLASGRDGLWSGWAQR